MFQNLLTPQNVSSGLAEKFWFAPVVWFAQNGIKGPDSGTTVITQDHVFQGNFGFVKMQCAPRKNKLDGKILGDLGLNKFELGFEFFVPGSYAELHEQMRAMMNVPLIVLCYDCACPVDDYYQLGSACQAAYLTIDFSSGTTNEGVKGYMGKIVTTGNAIIFYEGFIKEVDDSVDVGGFVLEEGGGYALLEDGGKILLEY